MTKKILLLFVLLLAFFSLSFPGKPAVLPELMKPGNIEIDGDNLYVLDGAAVYVYSMKDYRLLTKFGKKGQGPGELVPNDEIPLQMRLVNGKIFLNSQTKIIYYSKEGTMLKEKTLPFSCLQIIPLGEGFAISRPGFGTNGAFSLNVILYDAQLKPIKTLTSMKDKLSLRRKIVIPTPYIYLHCVNDTLFVTGGNHRDFHIEVFDEQGSPLTPIKTPYQGLELTDSFKNELIEWLKTDSRFSSAPIEVFQRLHFPGYLPAIRNIVVTDKTAGKRVKIYVQTYKQQGNLSEFFVFDFKGNPLKKVFLPTASRYKVKMNHEIAFTFYNNKYYYLVENLDAEEWELHMEEVNQEAVRE